MTEIQGQGKSKVLKTLMLFFRPLLHYPGCGPRLCGGECWLACQTEMLFSKVHGISDPKSRALQYTLTPGNRASFCMRHFGTFLCFLCFPVKTRLPPTSTSIALSAGSTDSGWAGVPSKTEAAQNKPLSCSMAASLAQSKTLAWLCLMRVPEPGMFLVRFASLFLSHQCGRGAQGCRWRASGGQVKVVANFIKRNSGSVTLSVLSAGEGAAWWARTITTSEYTQRRLPVQREKKTSGRR